MKRNCVLAVGFLVVTAVTGAVIVPDGLADARGVGAIKNTTKIFAQSDGLNGYAPERNAFVHRVSDLSDRHGLWRDAYGLSLGEGRTDLGRKDESDTGMRSYDKMLDRNFDQSLDSVNGHSQRPDPWWGSRGEGEPMLKELHREPSLR